MGEGTGAAERFEGALRRLDVEVERVGCAKLSEAMVGVWQCWGGRSEAVVAKYDKKL